MADQGLQKSALIVCSDDRALDLANVLSCRFITYRRMWSVQKTYSAWRWQIFDDGSFVPFDGAQSPRPSFDVLFFHNGNNDPEGIPDGLSIGKSFVFSRPGVQRNTRIEGHADAIAIPRRFEPKSCPVKDQHVFELEELLDGKRRELPAFCIEEQPTPTIIALVILCQSYLASAIVAGAFQQDCVAAKSLGWFQLPDAQQTNLRKKLMGWWERVREYQWWLESLGLLDPATGHYAPAAMNEFLLQLTDELELSWDLEKTGKLRNSVQELFLFLDGRSPDASIVELLKESPKPVEVVERAYETLRSILTTR